MLIGRHNQGVVHTLIIGISARELLAGESLAMIHTKAALLLLAACGGAAALRVAPPSSHGVRARAAPARMAYQKVNVPSAEEARKKKLRNAYN